MQKKKKLVIATDPTVMPAAPKVPNATRLHLKQNELQQLQADVVAQQIMQKTKSQQHVEHGKT